MESSPPPSTPFVGLIGEIAAKEEKDAFAKRFAQHWLEMRGYVRGKPDKREIHPLFAWLLMEEHNIDMIDVGMGNRVKGTEDPLLIELGKAVWTLSSEMTKQSSLAKIIGAYAKVQQLSQETTLRQVVGAQVMAKLWSWRLAGSNLEELQLYWSAYGVSTGYGTKLWTPEIEPILNRAGFTADDYATPRTIRVMRLLGETANKNESPFVPLATYKAYEQAYLIGAPKVIPDAGSQAQEITAAVDDDDTVVVEVEW